VDRIYLDAARELGYTLAEANVHCLYGAGDVGLMGALADAMLEKNGQITGVIPRFMLERNWNHTALDSLIVTETMHERKARMAIAADAAIALPGGCGTMEELLEIITWKQLGLFPKPIVIVNTNGYYDPLLSMLEKSIRERFMRPEHAEIWQVVSRAKEVLSVIKSLPEWKYNSQNFAVV
jgi:uncharacterized protein (TIGR00730 family)